MGEQSRARRNQRDALAVSCSPWSFGRWGVEGQRCFACSSAAPVTQQLLGSCLHSGELRAIFVLGSTQLFLRCTQTAQVIWWALYYCSVLLKCEISCVSILSRLLSQNKKKRQPILNSHLQVPVCLRWEGMAFVALCKKTQETNILSP